MSADDVTGLRIHRDCGCSSEALCVHYGGLADADTTWVRIRISLAAVRNTWEYGLKIWSMEGDMMEMAIEWEREREKIWRDLAFNPRWWRPRYASLILILTSTSPNSSCNIKHIDFTDSVIPIRAEAPAKAEAVPVVAEYMLILRVEDNVLGTTWKRTCENDNTKLGKAKPLVKAQRLKLLVSKIFRKKGYLLFKS
ncbi:hypothetical protein LXL04_000246 [Taraxacum kok-saghyz]